MRDTLEPPWNRAGFGAGTELKSRGLESSQGLHLTLIVNKSAREPEAGGALPGFWEPYACLSGASLELQIPERETPLSRWAGKGEGLCATAQAQFERRGIAPESVAIRDGQGVVGSFVEGHMDKLLTVRHCRVQGQLVCASFRDVDFVRDPGCGSPAGRILGVVKLLSAEKALVNRDAGGVCKVLGLDMDDPLRNPGRTVGEAFSGGDRRLLG